MKIGIDIRILAEKRVGKASQLLYVLKGFDAIDEGNEYILYTQKNPTDLNLGKQFRIKALNIPMPFWHMWCWWDFTFKENIDVFYASLSYIIPSFSKKCVILVHDVVSFLDISTHNKKAEFVEKITMGRALKNARAIIAVSKSTARDIEKIFNIPSRDITVVYEGIDQSFYQEVSAGEKQRVLKKYDINSGYIFYLSTLEPRKNIVRILKAYERLAEKKSDAPQLVMAGGKGWGYEVFEREYNASPTKDSIRLLGHVAPEDLPGLYQNARVYFFPALYEGFGLTLLEAMASKVPVITSPVSSLPEIGGGAALYVDTDDISGMAHALEDMLGDEDVYEGLREKAFIQAKKFDIIKMAHETLTVIEKLYAEKNT